jgi:IclR family transcriptional regulator, KDG regulon repressor
VRNSSLLPTVGAVARALALLDAFSPERPELGLTELARVTGISKATTYRLASTLERYHYLNHDPQSSRYRLGLRAIVLGNLALANLGFGDHILPYMRELAQQCGGTVSLAVLDDREVTYIKRIRSADPVLIDTPVGARAPAHATAIGKVLLAYLSNIELERIIATKGLVPLTSQTVTDPDALKSELHACRERGYVIEKGEFADGVHSVGAPIFDYHGRAVASLAVAGAAFRLTDDKLAQIREHLLATVQQISAVLGHKGIDSQPPMFDGASSIAMSP